jgi:hypothetical protein
MCLKVFFAASLGGLCNFLTMQRYEGLINPPKKSIEKVYILPSFLT